ncbi:MAG: alcohol dehydrogenase catalytic domain-containing protein [Chloroflexi bacterium]|nr:alcohol dehydrogenase catalytic domain-containing protein [Chloroflexota bacterium]
MNFDKVQRYKAAGGRIPNKQYAWPLYGPGLANLGKNAAPIVTDVPAFTETELLVRIDAVSLCYTDLKEIDQAQNHPRLKGRDLEQNPIVPGHEVSMTVVGVGARLAGEYKVGDRYTLQPDVWVDGKSIPFCFGMDGGYRQYAKIGSEILHGDAGNYLIPIPDEMTYSASAITEPWACVEAAYRMGYRQTLKPGGSVLVWGCEGSRQGYHLDEAWVQAAAPGEFVLCDVPAGLQAEITALCGRNHIDCVQRARQEIFAGEAGYDDLLLLDLPAQAVTTAGAHMKNEAVLAVLSGAAATGPVEIDLGRLHYDAILYTGATALEIREAYQATTARSEFKPGGTAWILGAGGPMGRMHLQRAIESTRGPSRILATEVSPVRLNSLSEFFVPLAGQHHKELILVNPVEEKDQFAAIMEKLMQQGGVDDVEVMVTFPELVVEACAYVAPQGVVNLFAGMKRGVKACVPAELFYGPQQVRFVGHSGSGLDDQKAVVERASTGQLKPQLSVAAVGGLCQIHAGVEAMKNSLYPGKIVIYPQVFDFPLTGLKQMKEALPEVYAALGHNETWSLQAETIFLEKELN